MCTTYIAKEEVKITEIDDIVDDIAKTWTGNLRGGISAATNENSIVKYQAAAKGATNPAKKLEDVGSKVKSGAQLKPLNTASGKWKSAFDKLKASGQLGNIDKKQAAKLTERVAQDVVKNPSKWRYLKIALAITFGVGFTGLVAASINAMVL
ncbi:hypothetical protein AM588_10001606 [Phytophthora nicotianae]|uniref:RxLR effector protein n=1 Tax=Phytophthora nicotianae TaxID=4792 RepID=A0A0W8CTC4_PHYNI|nr:hypothetical protein AM588_10001606 [Phytophthora nicotianae]